MPQERENRESNAEKMQEMIEHTEERMEASQGYMEHNRVKGEQKKEMKAKNARRQEAIENWQDEIDEEQTKL